MPYSLAFCDEPVPAIPQPPAANPATQQAPGAAYAPLRREHFGTEQAAMLRAAELLPAPAWRQMRLYGPDGVRIADQAALERRLAQPGASP